MKFSQKLSNQLKNVIMKKTLLLLFTCIAMTAGAQNMERCCADSANCAKECQLQGRKSGKGQHPGRMHFLKDLSEADRATVKDLMEQYHKEHKAILEKCRAQKPAKGEKPTEKQQDAMVKARYTARMEVLKLQEKYYDKLRKTLKPMQAAALLNKDGHDAKRHAAPGRHNGNGPRMGNMSCGHSCR